MFPGCKTGYFFRSQTGTQLQRALRRVLDPDEMLSPYGVRSLSRYHLAHPFTLQIGDVTAQIDYEPAESTSGLFGGNSNWRGPVWFPINYLFIDALVPLQPVLRPVAESRAPGRLRECI